MVDKVRYKKHAFNRPKGNDRCAASLLLLTGLLVVPLLLASCSTASTQTTASIQIPVPTSFVTTFPDGVAFLQWHDKGHNTLTGLYLSTNTQGKAQREEITGSLQDTKVTLSTSATPKFLTGIWQDQRLQTQSVQRKTMTWYAATERDYLQLVIALSAYTAVQINQKSLQKLIHGPLPQDSDPLYYQQQLQAAGTYVAGEQDLLEEMKSKQGTAVCSINTTFQMKYPPSQAPIQLPFTQPQDTSPQAVVNRSQLSQVTQTLQHQWNSAHSLPVPHISGIPWLVNPQRDLTNATMALGQLQTTVLTDSQQFRLLRQQHEAIHTQVSQLTARC